MQNAVNINLASTMAVAYSIGPLRESLIEGRHYPAAALLWLSHQKEFVEIFVLWTSTTRSCMVIEVNGRHKLGGRRATPILTKASISCHCAWKWQY